MLQFFGKYFHKIDDKGRVSLPMKFRKTYERAQKNGSLANLDLVVTLSPEKNDEGGRKCLYVFTTDDFNAYVDSLFEVAGGFNPRNKQHEQLNRALHAQVEDLSIDSANRINIPQKFRDIAGIGKEVALVGNSGHIELWDAKRIDNELESIDLEDLIYE